MGMEDAPQETYQHLGIKGEEKMKKNTYKTLIISLVIVAIAVVMACIIVTVVPRERTSKAQKYDLDCVTQLNAKPLQECRQ